MTDVNKRYKPVCLSICNLLYPSDSKGLIYTKSNLSLINMSISTHIQLISVLVYKTLNFMTPFYGWGSTVSMLESHNEEPVYLSPLSFQKVLVLTWSTSKVQKAESTLEPTCGFEHGAPGLGIQHLNH